MVFEKIIQDKWFADLLKKTDDGLGLQLKQGIHIPIKGIYNSGTRKLNIEFGWQERFHDHIIRNEGEYMRISEYILNNPAN